MRGRMCWLAVMCAIHAGCGDDGTAPTEGGDLGPAVGAPDAAVADLGDDLGSEDLGAGDLGDQGTDAGDAGTGGDPELVYPPGCVSLDAPIGTAAPSADRVDHALSPDRFAEGLDAPFPTNAWWGPMVVGAGDLVGNALPYLLQTTDAGRFVSAPRIRESPTVISTNFVVDWRLAANEPFRRREIAAYDDLSTTVRFVSDTTAVEAPLVRGMPYVSMRYAGLTPRLESPHPILSVNGSTAASVTGDRFVVPLGTGQTWIVYASSSITLSVSTNALAASAPLSGWVRVALLPAGVDASVLAASARAVPTGGEVVLRGCGARGPPWPGPVGVARPVAHPGWHLRAPHRCSLRARWPGPEASRACRGPDRSRGSPTRWRACPRRTRRRERPTRR